jgi:hypothetical protein
MGAQYVSGGAQLTRANFVRERRKRGRLADTGASHTCEKCHKWVEIVTTRKEPWLYLVFNQGPNGELHHCPRRLFAH